MKLEYQKRIKYFYKKARLYNLTIENITFLWSLN